MAFLRALLLLFQVYMIEAFGWKKEETFFPMSVYNELSEGHRACLGQVPTSRCTTVSRGMSAVIGLG